MLLFPQSYAGRVARFRVLLGFILAAAFAWFSRPVGWSLAAGLPLAVLGLALRAWAAGCLAKDRQLATGGPYAYTRNPLYLGTLVVAAGLALAARSLGLAALFAAFFVLVYLPVIQNEQQHLGKLFPQYPSYAAAVPALWPRFRGARGPRAFQWSLYRKNQEYQAAAGFAVGALFLIWKIPR